MSMDEEYVHYQEAITSLNRSWRTLCELETHKSGGAIWSAAYRMALIEYCKPFKISYGTNKVKHKLTSPKLDQEKLILHKHILDLRDQVLAHSDITVLDAKVSYDNNAVFPVTLIISNRLGDLPKVTDIRNLVEAVLDELYLEQEKYNKQYANKP